MSNLLERKRRTIFQHLDLDQDGVITVKDYLELANRFTESGNLKGQDAARCKERMLKVRS